MNNLEERFRSRLPYIDKYMKAYFQNLHDASVTLVQKNGLWFYDFSIEAQINAVNHTVQDRLDCRLFGVSLLMDNMHIERACNRVLYFFIERFFLNPEWKNLSLDISKFPTPEFDGKLREFFDGCTNNIAWKFSIEEDVHSLSLRYFITGEVNINGAVFSKTILSCCFSPFSKRNIAAEFNLPVWEFLFAIQHYFLSDGYDKLECFPAQFGAYDKDS